MTIYVVIYKLNVDDPYSIEVSHHKTLEGATDFALSYKGIFNEHFDKGWDHGFVSSKGEYLRIREVPLND